ncbi:MAG: N-6 DNA methylase, partial [Anaerolineales bacterium]
VSRVMAQVIEIERADTMDAPTVYDPTCGSGSLLIKAADIANTQKLAIYGQEMDVATWALARMNMILHGYPTAEIWHGNTLSSPGFTNPDGSLKTFDFAVANPPFSQKNWTNGLDPEHDPYGRFEYGVPPAEYGDYAFLLHLIKSLKSRGKGAIILPHGVLFRGKREADIRRNLVRHGLIKGIIGLPPNLFYGTGIPACIIVIDKEKAGTRQGIFMIDASKGYVKDGNKNRLREQDIRKIVDVFRGQIEIPGYSRLVPFAEIEANEYNLNIPRYIDSSEPEDLHDLSAHLHGGIPQRDVDALAAYWQVFPNLPETLFQSNGRPGYVEPRLPAEQVRATILAHPDYLAFRQRVMAIFAEWRAAHEPRLRALKENDRPRDLIRVLADDLLARFREIPLLDPYDLYQALMDYWHETLQDDAYLIAAEGWLKAARPRPVIEDEDRKIKETPDLTVGRVKYKMDLLPPDLIVAHYFAAEQAKVERLETAAETAEAELDTFVEEYGAETGEGPSPLAEVMDDDGKITKTRVQARLRELTAGLFATAEDAAEIEALQRWLDLNDAVSAAKKAAKEARAALEEQILEKYQTLTEAEIKDLVVGKKWLAALERAILARTEGVASRLAARVAELAARYARPLPELEAEVERYAARVAEHLKRMGVAG